MCCYVLLVVVGCFSCAPSPSSPHLVGVLLQVRLPMRCHLQRVRQRQHLQVRVGQNRGITRLTCKARDCKQRGGPG
jgi:hypothetical protein